MPKCPYCETEMKPLVVSFYCPYDCDKKTEAERLLVKTVCKRCGSHQTEAFTNCSIANWRCVDCGHIWYV